MSDSFEGETTAEVKADLRTIKQDMTDLKSSIQMIAQAVTKLAILEDRQATQNTLIQKLLSRLEHVEEKQHETELRICSTTMNTERLNSVETATNTILTKIAGFEGSAKTASTGIKAGWAILGAVVSAALILMTNRGGL